MQTESEQSSMNALKTLVDFFSFDNSCRSWILFFHENGNDGQLLTMMLIIIVGNLETTI